MTASQQQLYEALTESIAELEAFFDVPGDSPTMSRLRAIAKQLRPMQPDVDQILEQIRAHRAKVKGNRQLSDTQP